MHYTELPSKEDMTSLHGETWTWVEGVVAPLDGALAGPVSEAVGQYAADVRARKFPGPEHCFNGPAVAARRETGT